jgi:hypothetical protein
LKKKKKRYWLPKSFSPLERWRLWACRQKCVETFEKYNNIFILKSFLRRRVYRRHVVCRRLCCRQIVFFCVVAFPMIFVFTIFFLYNSTVFLFFLFCDFFFGFIYVLLSNFDDDKFFVIVFLHEFKGATTTEQLLCMWFFTFYTQKSFCVFLITHENFSGRK